MPLHSRMSRAICSWVMEAAEKMMSPSFSRSSSKDAPAFADGGDGGFYALIAGGGELMLAHGALQRVGCAASGRQTGAPRHNAAARELCMLRLSRRVNAPAVHFSFIRTVTVGSGFPPDLLTPPRGGRSRALPESGNTAGGDFHPALRIAGV